MPVWFDVTKEDTHNGKTTLIVSHQQIGGWIMTNCESINVDTNVHSQKY